MSQELRPIDKLKALVRQRSAERDNLPLEERRRAMFSAVDLHEMNNQVDRGHHFTDTIYATADDHPDWRDEIRLWHDRWIEMAAPVIDHSVRLLRALRATGESVLWLDADAEIRSNISEMVPMRPLDFAIHHEENRSPKWSFRSGTVWFNSTPAAHRLAEDWGRRCEEAPDRFDQESLYLAWHGMGQAINVRAHWLPMSYCQRIGEPDHKDEDAHILHYQASRETRKKRAGRMG